MDRSLVKKNVNDKKETAIIKDFSDYYKATHIINDVFLKNGIKTILKQPDRDWWGDEPMVDSIYLPYQVYLLISPILFTTVHNSFSIEVKAWIPLYGYPVMEEWEIKIDDKTSIHHAIQRTYQLIEEIKDAEEVGLVFEDSPFPS